MKLNVFRTVFTACLLAAGLASCKKPGHQYDPYPYRYTGVLPDTNRFAIPYTYYTVNGYTTFYYPNSTVISSQGNYQNGSPSGYWKQYYPDGRLMKEGNYSNGQLSGNWVFYYPSGIKKEAGNYQNTVKSGTWTYYYEDGSISSQGNYSNGVKEGQWTNYNPDGSLSSTISY